MSPYPGTPFDLAVVVRHTDFDGVGIEESLSLMRAFESFEEAEVEAARLNAVARPLARYFVLSLRQRHPVVSSAE